MSWLRFISDDYAQLLAERDQLLQDKAELERLLASRPPVPKIEDWQAPAGAEFAFNFKDPSIRVFSIERILHSWDGIPAPVWSTYIAYYHADDPKKTIHNWYFICNQQVHNDIVEMWRKSLE